jgi:hypothetical protein
MANAITEICRWAKTLPAWEQETLRMILTGEEFNDAAYENLGALLIAGADASAVDLTPFEHAAVTNATHKTKLVSIADATNINALIDKQTIEFSEGLTLIFGGTASGKSGYARLFGNACFTRGDREVLPNFLKTDSAGREKCAVISIDKDGTIVRIHHRCDRPVPELGGFYVFDTTCVSAHLTKTNALTFTPPGLEVLKQLAFHTDAVRHLINDAIVEATKPHLFGALFEGESVVTKFVSELNAATDLKQLRTLSELTTADCTKIEEIEKEIARLKLLDVSKAVAAKRREIFSLQQLRDALAALDPVVSDVRMAQLENELQLLQQHTKRAEQFGARQFAVDGLRTPGSDAWAEFVQLAKRLANLESAEPQPYPQDGSRCLLCQQPLSAEAAALLRRMWAFLEDDTKQSLRSSRQTLATRRIELEQQVCLVCQPTGAAYQILTDLAPNLLEFVVAYQNAANDRRQSAIRAIDTPRSRSPFLGSGPALPGSPVPQLDEVINACREHLTALEKTDPGKRILAAERELLVFRHRQLLSKQLPAIVKYVENHKSAADARLKVNTSHHITAKHNEMFDVRVSNRYRTVFEQLLSALGGPLRAKIVATGQKGAAMKTLHLDLPGAAQHPRGLPQHVFSEGEKRAVVLADFLAEVSLDPNSSGIILDDPVTSLDAEWKDGIARVLIEHCNDQQVIVFTHDLHFLYLLNRYADIGGSKISNHWMRRGSDGLPGYVFLNNSPATEKQYRTTQIANEHLARAKKTQNPNEQERFLRDGFAALRTTYEVFVLRDLFGEVVQRFDERISIERLKDAYLDREVINTVIEKVAILSRYIEGHSHSDAFAAARPEIDTLQKEIADFEQLRAKQKAGKKVAQLG